ncbi:hypothetical protein [Aquibaculum sediminis]|uniref:hypothetical protein n=1 Tax=Aquibaculum sediminis TaxID=3231907 RepID=UPI003456294F
MQKALEGAQFDLGFTRLSAEAWREARSVSIDYAIMEHADNLWVMPHSGEWSDLGGWPAVWQQGRQDPDGNVCSAHATAIECKNSLLRSEDPHLELSA